MLIQLGPFAGMRPRVSPEYLENSQSQDAVNAKLWSGELRPFYRHRLVQKIGNTGPVNSLYLLGDRYWLVSMDALDFVPNMLADEVLNRTYFSVEAETEDNPRVVDTALIQQSIDEGYFEQMYGLSEYANLDSLAVYLHPPDDHSWIYNGTAWNSLPFNTATEAFPDIYYRLGVPAPEIALQLDAGAVPTPETEERVIIYCETYVNEWGEESKEGPYSEEITVQHGQPVTLTSNTVYPDGKFKEITHKRIYRLNTTTDGDGVFQFVDEIPLDQAEYVDEKLDSELGEALVTEDFDLPPGDLRGLSMHPAGYMVGFREKEICFSEPGYPYAWPRKYRLSTDWPIVGLGFHGGTMIVLTTAYPCLVYGSSPEESQRHKLYGNYGCTAKRGIVSTEYGVVFPSKTGLCLADGNGNISNMTASELTVDEWRRYSKGLSHGVVFNQKYFGFYSTGDERGAFVVDPAEPAASFVRISLHSTAAYVREDTGQLFLLEEFSGENATVEFEGNRLRPVRYSWHSKKYSTPPVNLAAGKIFIGRRTLTKEEIRDSLVSLAGDYFDVDVLESYGGIVNGSAWNTYDFGGGAASPALLQEVFAFDVELTVLADSREVYRQNISTAKPFRLPSGCRAMESLEFILNGTADVQKVLLGTSIEEVSHAQ